MAYRTVELNTTVINTVKAIGCIHQGYEEGLDKDYEFK
jgi:hypothetical protein